MMACSENKTSEMQNEQTNLDNMGVLLSSEDNRPISFSNKEAAFYYTQSHKNNHPEHSYFEGLTIGQKKVFNGYQLYKDNQALPDSLSAVTVYPHKMIRNFAEGSESEFWMLDSLNIMEVSLKCSSPNSLKGIYIKNLKLHELDTVQNIAILKNEAEDKPNFYVGVGAMGSGALKVEGTIVSGSGLDGFFIVAGKSREELIELSNIYRTKATVLKAKRKQRIENLLSQTVINSNIDTLNLALRWLTITTDQLVTHQRGHGIYAGLPWFAEYWGRDQFISMPGAVLVNGQFSIARDILASFSRFQDTNPSSSYYGRVPNILTMENINYHTTDGTPRFIIQLMEYVKYSGDEDIIRELYPSVKMSIEGAIKNWTDSKGYLLHEHNETWMDARREHDKMPYSPRGSRANDIQALWVQQLLAGVYFAQFMDDEHNAKHWQQMADKVITNFRKDFASSQYDYLADRLSPKNEADFQLRPNQLFALDIIANSDLKRSSVKQCWEHLMYPWGMASLSNEDANFHPYHLKWDCYHKDQSYHNGTVWVWLNGIAMQRMLELNQTEIAFDLFTKINKQALDRGVVGGLGENLDPYPQPGSSYPKLTGTYLQAWSNAEHLRIWSQYFLGVRPDMINNSVVVAPRLPKAINKLNTKLLIGKGCLMMEYERNDSEQTYSYISDELDSELCIDLPSFPITKVKINNKALVKITLKNQTVKLETFSHYENKQAEDTQIIQSSEERSRELNKNNKYFENVHYCQPLKLSEHKVLQQTFGMPQD